MFIEVCGALGHHILAYINYLLTKRGRGDNGIVTVVTMALCAGAGRGYGAILTTVLTTVGSSILSVNEC